MIEPSTPQPNAPPVPPPPPPAAPSRQERPQALLAAYHRLIAEVRARQRRQLWLQGILYGAGAAALLLFLSGFAAHLSVDLGRALALLAPFIAVGVVGFFGFYLATRRVGDEVRTARLIGERVPGNSLDFLGAVEIERELQKDPSFSSELARAFLAHIGARAERLDPRRVVPPGGVRRATRSVAGLAVLLLILLACWPTFWAKGMAGVLAGNTPEALQAQREPITGDIELIYRYPVYTGLAARTITGTGGEITAVAGTEVVLQTRADRDVARAELTVNGKALPMEISGKRDLQGHFILDKSGSYAIVFRKLSGSEVARGPEIPIHVEADAAPQVVIQTPGEEIEIDPGQQVTLKYEATDDYGITSLELVYKAPGKSQETRVPLRHDEGRRTKGQHTWDLSSIKMAPGDRITYSLEAKDNDEVSGKKAGASRVHVLKVYSAMEHRRAALEKAQQLWERLVTQLGDRMEGPDRAAQKDSQKVIGQQTVDRTGQQIASDLTTAAQEIALLRDSPQELWAALVNVSQSLRPKVQATADARRFFLRYQRTSANDPSWGKRLTQATSGEIGELEKDVLYLETLLDRQRLQDLEEMGKELNRERRELTSLLEQFKQTKDPKVQEDIILQIQALRGRIDELMQRMGEMARGIRDEHLNSEALQQMMQEKDMGAALDEVEKLVREGKADDALKKLQELGMQMDQMLKNLDGAEQNFGQEQFPELGGKFQKFSQALQKTADDQKKVAEKTQEMSNRYKAKMKDRLQQKGRAMKDELLKQVEQVTKDYRTLDVNELSTSAERPMEEIQAELDNLRNALKVEDFDLAAEAAQRAQRAADDLSNYAQQQKKMDETYQRPDDLRQQSSKLAKRLSKDAQQVDEVNQKLQQLFPQPGSMLSEEDKQKLKQLSGEQKDLEKRAQGLRQQMEEMQQVAPVFGEDALEQMNQVSERMDGAAQKLDGKDPGRGHAEQKAALDQLGQLQQQMQQQQGKPKTGQGMPLPMFAGRREGWGQSQSQQKVEIPDADQFQAPKEFRKDLLDAMKQGTPDKYRDQVKRYYEELVK